MVIIDTVNNVVVQLVQSLQEIEFFLDLVDEPRPVVIFESPHRIIGCMTDIIGLFKGRRIAICRELTKIHESLVVRPINEISVFTVDK